MHLPRPQFHKKNTILAIFLPASMERSSIYISFLINHDIELIVNSFSMEHFTSKKPIWATQRINLVFLESK